MAADFEKLYGEPLHHLESTTVTIPELDLVLNEQREVKRPEGQEFILKDRKQGRFYVASPEGRFVLPKKNDYVILMSTQSFIPFTPPDCSSPGDPRFFGC